MSDQDSTYPEWFSSYLESRRRLKRSPHTLAAITADFTMIGTSLLPAGRPLAELPLSYLTKHRLGTAFAAYADDHAPNSCRRCRSSWNQLCQWLINREYLSGGNPMRTIEVAQPETGAPKALTGEDIAALLAAADIVDAPPQSWPQLDRLVILLGVLAGPRTAELLDATVGDVRLTEQGPVLQLRGKGRKHRTVPIEPAILDVIDDYMRSREELFGATVVRPAVDIPLRRFLAADPLLVGNDGKRLTRGSLQYRIRRAYRRAGIQSPEGANLHAFRHTYAVSLADIGIDPFKLRDLLGHESLTATQRYTDSAGQRNREAAAANPLYGLLAD